MARTRAVLGVGVFLLGLQLAAAAPQTGRGGQRPGTQRPAPAPAARQPPSNPPAVSAIGLRVVGHGLGANGSELRPFNESPGTTVVLAIQASGGATLTIGEAKVDEESTRISFGLLRSVLTTIREVRFFDAKNAPIESRRSGSGYMNEKANLDYEVKTKDKSVTIEFELWQTPRPAKVEKAPVPPLVITAADGAASVDAVVKQMQTAALAGKGAQVLSVIYPTDRPSYGQAMAMVLTFLPMGSMDNAAASEKLQKDLDAFFAKHKIKPPFAREPADLFQGVDLTAFVSESMLFLKSHAKKGEDPGLPVPSGKPEDVKITGDTAVATLGGKEVKFARISGKWFIRLE